MSKTAVSFAFNAPDRLGTDTVTHIINVATALGYRPHPVASSLARRRTGTLAILTPQPLGEIFANPYHALFASGVATAAEEAGYALQFISPLRGSLGRAVERASVDGIIAVGLDPEPSGGRPHPAVGMRIVLVDAVESELAPSVSVDDEAGAYAAAAHLVGLGHRDVLVLSVEPPAGSDGTPAAVAAQRLTGIGAPSRTRAPRPPRRPCRRAPRPTIQGGHEAFARCLGRRPATHGRPGHERRDRDRRAARDPGDRASTVPGDLSIVGFDDIEHAPYTDPPLTTIHQPVREKGRTAVRLLLHDPARHGRPGRARTARSPAGHPRLHRPGSPTRQEVGDGRATDRGPSACRRRQGGTGIGAVARRRRSVRARRRRSTCCRRNG